jgi:hypothetical protein
MAQYLVPSRLSGDRNGPMGELLSWCSAAIKLMSGHFAVGGTNMKRGAIETRLLRYLVDLKFVINN